MHVTGIRRLIWIPIIHSQSDLGSVGESLRQLYVHRTSHEDWDRHIRTVNDAWERIRQTVDQLDLDYGAVRVYQDGLPQCGHEADIVKDLAASGSQNHRILLELAGRGATIVGTESADLLLEEYELVRLCLARLAKDDADDLTGQYEQLRKLVLEKRDQFIARRVDETLKPGEVGLVFLGLLHALERFLPPDIEMTSEAWWASKDA